MVVDEHFGALAVRERVIVVVLAEEQLQLQASQLASTLDDKRLCSVRVERETAAEPVIPVVLKAGLWAHTVVEYTTGNELV